MPPLPSVPSPRTWALNDLILVPRLRADVSDAVAFLASRPFFLGQNSTGASWGSGTDSNLGLNVELADPWNMHNYTGSGPGNSSQLFAQAPGWYLCRATVPFPTTSTQALYAAGFNWVTGGVTQTTIKGGLHLNGSTHPAAAQCWDLIEQTVTGPIGGSGDFIQPTAFQNTGGSINLVATAAQMPTVSVRWVCATTGTEPLPVPPLTAVPSPITSAWMNANIRDTINFLIYPPICKAIYVPGSATLASFIFPAGATVPLNSATVDNYGAFNTSTFTFTAPVAGSYFCYGQFALATSASSTGYRAGFTVNGGTTVWGDMLNKVSDANGGGATCTKRIRLNAGDTVRFTACQSSGGAIAYNTGPVSQSRALFVWDGA